MPGRRRPAATAWGRGATRAPAAGARAASGPSAARPRAGAPAPAAPAAAAPRSPPAAARSRLRRPATPSSGALLPAGTLRARAHARTRCRSTAFTTPCIRGDRAAGAGAGACGGAPAGGAIHTLYRGCGLHIPCIYPICTLRYPTQGRACEQHVSGGGHVPGGRAQRLQLAVQEGQLVGRLAHRARMARRHVQHAPALHHRARLPPPRVRGPDTAPCCRPRPRRPCHGLLSCGGAGVRQGRSHSEGGSSRSCLHGTARHPTPPPAPRIASSKPECRACRSRLLAAKAGRRRGGESPSGAQRRRRPAAARPAAPAARARSHRGRARGRGLGGPLGSAPCWPTARPRAGAAGAAWWRAGAPAARASCARRGAGHRPVMRPSALRARAGAGERPGQPRWRAPRRAGALPADRRCPPGAAGALLSMGSAGAPLLDCERARPCQPALPSPCAQRGGTTSDNHSGCGGIRLPVRPVRRLPQAQGTVHSRQAPAGALAVWRRPPAWLSATAGQPRAPPGAPLRIRLAGEAVGQLPQAPIRLFDHHIQHVAQVGEPQRPAQLWLLPGRHRVYPPPPAQQHRTWLRHAAATKAPPSLGLAVLAARLSTLASGALGGQSYGVWSPPRCTFCRRFFMGYPACCSRPRAGAAHGFQACTVVALVLDGQAPRISFISKQADFTCSMHVKPLNTCSGLAFAMSDHAHRQHIGFRFEHEPSLTTTSTPA